VKNSGDSFFIFGTKDKLWIVGNVFGEQYIQEFKNYSLYMFSTTIQNEYNEISVLGSTKSKIVEMVENPVEVDIKLACGSKDFSTIVDSDLGPEDFYSIPEITKLSKIITRKLSKLKKK